MNTDFGAYIKELVKKFSENGISAEEKNLQYGCQLVLAKGTDKAVLSVYNGKKGIICPQPRHRRKRRKIYN